MRISTLVTLLAYTITGKPSSLQCGLKRNRINNDITNYEQLLGGDKNLKYLLYEMLQC